MPIIIGYLSSNGKYFFCNYDNYKEQPIVSNNVISFTVVPGIAGPWG